MGTTLEEKLGLCGELNQMGYLRGTFGLFRDRADIAYQNSVHATPTFISKTDLLDLHGAMLAVYKARAHYSVVVCRILDDGFLRQQRKAGEGTEES